MYGSKGKLAKLNYLEIKLLLDRRIVKNKRGSLSEREIQTFGKGLARQALGRRSPTGDNRDGN